MSYAKPKILIAGMPWCKDYTEFILPHNLDLMIEHHGKRFQFIFDCDYDTYESHTVDEEIDLCLALHGNRKCEYMSERFEYLDEVCDNVWIMHESYMADYIILDRSGYKGGASLAEPDVTIDIINDIDDAECEKFVNNLYNSQIAPKLSGKKFPKEDFILFAGQMPDDSSIPTSMGKRIYAEVVIKALNRLDKVGKPILYKPHPKMDSDASPWGKSQEEIIRDLIKCKMWKNVELVTDFSIYDLIVDAYCVISICSGSIFESILCHRPSFNLGKSDLKDFVYTVEDYEELRDLDTLVNSKTENRVDMNRYIYSYVKGYLRQTSADKMFLMLRELVKL